MDDVSLVTCESQEYNHERDMVCKPLDDDDDDDDDDHDDDHDHEDDHDDHDDVDVYTTVSTTVILNITTDTRVWQVRKLCESFGCVLLKVWINDARHTSHFTRNTSPITLTRHTLRVTGGIPD